jgi:hypothetical protein
MTRIAFATLALGILASAAPAQPSSNQQYNLNLYGPGLVSPYNSSFTRPGPNLSPYLNLLRGGNPAANYYLGVVPEVERRNNAAAFRAGIQDLALRVENPPAEQDQVFTSLPQTGHPVQFFNFSTYFGSGQRPYGSPQQPGQAAGPTTPPRRR